MIPRRLLHIVATTFVLVGLAPWLASANQVDLLEPTFRVSFEDRFLTVGNHFFAPNELQLTAGTSIRFHIANGTPAHVHLHSFVILAEDGSVVGGRFDALAVDVETVIEWMPPGPGRYLVVCTFCPAEEGMVITVIVV
jgi:plastocyanin